MKDRSLERVRTASFYMDKRKEEVIFDFADDWHCALQLEPGMKKDDVAAKLVSLAEVIGRRVREENTPYDLYRRPLGDFESQLSVRLYNSLKWENNYDRERDDLRRYGQVFIGDICRLKEAELLKFPNFGRVTLNELREFLKSLGLKTGAIIPGWDAIVKTLKEQHHVE